mmetsp:Transcript_22758/g.51321  ORF Transcript_22758/g.51321 Transcript_22758/m.51321 type:complete len:411 (+) Transcript_22758:265-1497(+)|eukprot:CAMPEP_0172616286 /NCGR_PEP_ID=MMETSP1068-20121228/63457_1 /TAXON_ID=35684 /ORGANISM="Pseudopedinella elastica, Strain CCMP716" /LENGTH=410 /DNA_ID=CAMNT_0013421667 /DNA_START=237 /DNA_END=1469 /DNA_ORIENTATION=-
MTTGRALKLVFAFLCAADAFLTARRLSPTLASPSSRCAVLSQGESRRPAELQATIDATGFKFYCEVCQIGFSKKKNFEAHLAGRAHGRVVAEREGSWADFVSRAPSWASSGVPDEAEPLDVATPWSPNELANFPMRSTCLDQSVTVRDLCPKLRARFFRYLRCTFGAHYCEVVNILHHVDTTTGPQYLRVKELFESVEAYRVVASHLLSAQQQGKQVDAIWDMASGHGLVGVLLAYRFPRKKVVCVDLERRPAFDAYVQAWRAEGHALEEAGEAESLSNLEFRLGDLNEAMHKVTSSSCVIAVHACNEANRDTVEGARSRGAIWAVMPCCIRQKLYLPDASLELDDQTRYTLLAGAFANQYGAQILRTIDRRITARHVVICGGLDRPTSSNDPPARAKPPKQKRGLAMPK